MDEIYLDNSATTRPLPEVIEKMKNVLEVNYGNPSSLHNKGLAAEQYLKTARKLLADKLGVRDNEIYFTSGGTESNNLALKGTAYNYKNRGQHLITTQIEHPSVYNVMRTLEEEGFTVTYLKPDKSGIIRPEALKEALTPQTILVSIMQVNNELGSKQPIKKFSQVLQNYNPDIFFHVDAVQAFGKIPVKPRSNNIDLLSLSGHKFHGPKGIGILYFSNHMLIKPLFQGGGQENDIRPGTENIPGIAGLIPALENMTVSQKIAKLKKLFLEQIQKQVPQVRVNTPQQSAPHIISISFPGIKGEILVHALEEENIYVSTGSACHSRRQNDNRVLKAIDLPPKYINGTIRLSLSKFNTEQEINFTVEQIKKKIDYLTI
ncbi:MAG: cysteine desulfurase family protein [Halanaerobiaceae bacterium]